MGRMIKLARSLNSEQQATRFISVSLDAARERPEDLANYSRSVLPRMWIGNCCVDRKIQSIIYGGTWGSMI